MEIKLHNGKCVFLVMINIDQRSVRQKKLMDVTSFIANCKGGNVGATLKEYYEIVDEARPLSRFFPTHADFFTECIFNHETKQASMFQSDPSSNSFTIDFLFVFCISFYTSSVVF